jgi:hypothetical protein
MTIDYDQYEIKLANEIADTLNNRDALPLFLQYARKYQEGFLRKILARVMSIPESKIRRTRGALFTFLVMQSSNHGDPRN